MMQTMKYTVLNPSEIAEKNQYNISEISPFDVGIPLVDCSDKNIEEVYYYRWHSFCSHIKNTPLGYIITEFTPEVFWGGIYGSIACPIGHHMYEGRWLHHQKYLSDYARFWFQEGANPMTYSTWLSDSVYAICQVTGDFSLAESLYEDLKANYRKWTEKHSFGESGNLLFQVDDMDGMEFSASGSGCRPTINSYHYGDAVALAKIAEKLGKTEDKEYYENEARHLKELMDMLLWDPEASFYKNRKNGYWLCDIRELIGYLPWYFNMPDEDKNEAWKFLNDQEYFYAPYGPTTVERNYSEFMREYPHVCLWNGPSWPFATSQTLTALGNFLNNYHQDVMNKSDYFNWLKLYANSQYDTLENGEKIPYVDENLDPFTGEWLTRKNIRNLGWDEFNQTRGRHYNHSSFCDLVLSGLAGVRARDDEQIEINPLFSENDLDYFCADGILYHNQYLTVLWDKTGNRYNKGAGLQIYVDGVLKAKRANLEKIIIKNED